MRQAGERGGFSEVAGGELAAVFTMDEPFRRAASIFVELALDEQFDLDDGFRGVMTLGFD